MHTFLKQVSFLLILMFIPMVHSSAQSKPYSDLHHASKVFGHPKSYRLYLPQQYEKSAVRYPVIYFFHGWGGRHYKDDNALLEYELIGQLVDRYQIILVMWDGNMEESQPRPYNIGNHKDILYPVQMKDYFPELVSHIDSAYRTLSDREHRGIIGFSMGGIMSFFLAGKYPDQVCAAVNFAGTPEFFIGTPENHTLYPVRYTFKNLMEVNTMQFSGHTDILTYLNEEVRKGAEWEGNPYTFYAFNGGHMIDKPGETLLFEKAIRFITESFNKPLPAGRWSHYDLYPDFSIRHYHVTADKNEPGFLYLRNVALQGFGFRSLKWLPGGPEILPLKAEITTAPVYVPLESYQLIRYTCGNDHFTETVVNAGNDGSIHIQHEGGNTEYGIFRDGDEPDWIASGYSINQNDHYVNPGKNQLQIRLLNRAGLMPDPETLQVRITCHDPGFMLTDSVISCVVNPQQRLVNVPLQITHSSLPPEHGEPFQIKLELEITGTGHPCRDDLVVPVLFDVPAFENIRVDDGVAVGGLKAYGEGNGNGIPEAGEKILLYGDGHRLRLYTNDPYVISKDEMLVDEQLPSVWEDSFTLSSIVAISADCPADHEIEFTANYETVTYNPIERKVHWGMVKVKTAK